MFSQSRLKRLIESFFYGVAVFNDGDMIPETLAKAFRIDGISNQVTRETRHVTQLQFQLI